MIDMLSFFSFIWPIGIILFFKLYFSSYMKEKAKNLAQKEDIEGITDKIEGIKKLYNSELEELRKDINLRIDAEGKKRAVYRDFIRSLDVFICGRQNEDKKKVFLDCYSELWLWAPDEVIVSVNRFIDIQISLAAGQHIDQIEIKESYSECIFVLRKDCNVDTILEQNQYKYVVFDSE
ncbi:hypothetical protein [Photobacterium damselae]|uniref:hypothetical protein n=1 Tax=Photobacterium damselae TaxID=38293 RepID=UPI000E004996|nr:hypothetical protein [Photobacterium damselae]SUB66871.1 Uncharacterised protein [Photobacterium damselae]